jgi:hypothetical protein
MKTFPVADLDIFYISYDEPNADENFGHLHDIHQRAPRGGVLRRVHGVKGFHAAHRRCAELSGSRRFVTVDGDNRVHSTLFEQTLDETGIEDVVFSFKARNIVNGLEYGNGGVKIWPRGLVLNVPTHEEADSEQESTDFCWTYRYYQIDDVMSTVKCNGSHMQAFRAGYREGIKMSLIGGRRLSKWSDAVAGFYQPNFIRLKMWATVGTDVDNGEWAVFGTRQALHDMWMGDAPVMDLVKDYDLFRQYFQKFSHCVAEIEAADLGILLNQHLDMDLVVLDPKQSAFVKSVFSNPVRAGLMIPDMPAVEFDDV